MLGAASVQNCIQVNKIRRLFCKDHYSTGNYMVRLGLLLFAILILVYQVFDVIICQHFVGYILRIAKNIYLLYLGFIQAAFQYIYNEQANETSNSLSFDSECLPQFHYWTGYRIRYQSTRYSFV